MLCRRNFAAAVISAVGALGILGRIRFSPSRGGARGRRRFNDDELTITVNATGEKFRFFPGEPNADGTLGPVEGFYNGVRMSGGAMNDDGWQYFHTSVVDSKTGRLKYAQAAVQPHAETVAAIQSLATYALKG